MAESNSVQVSIEGNFLTVTQTEEQMVQTPEKTRPSTREALSVIFSWHSYTLFLITTWIFYAFDSLMLFYNLYLRDLGWSFVVIGALSGINMIIAASSRIVGGYIGDVADRKLLATIAMLFASMFFLLSALFIHPAIIVLALLIYSSMNLVKSGSSAYIMDNVPREHSGLALSLFKAGRVTGVAMLLAFNVLVATSGFGAGYRILMLVGGLCLLASTIVRAYWLTPSPPQQRTRTVSISRDFIHENWKAFRLLITTLPGAIIIVILDAINDGLFKFGALLYANEYLGISIPGIGTILIATLLISVPLLLKVGRLADTRGLKRASLMVYSLMPISTTLILIAPFLPTWAPQSIITGAESIFPGLGSVFTTVFIGIVLKYVNDGLWWLLLMTMIRKSLPRDGTSKFLAIFWFFVMALASIGPFIGGVLFALGSPQLIFVASLILNALILLSIARNGLARHVET